MLSISIYIVLGVPSTTPYIYPPWIKEKKERNRSLGILELLKFPRDDEKRSKKKWNKTNISHEKHSAEEENQKH